jgi:hypothetical protein
LQNAWSKPQKKEEPFTFAIFELLHHGVSAAAKHDLPPSSWLPPSEDNNQGASAGLIILTSPEGFRIEDSLTPGFLLVSASNW